MTIKAHVVWPLPAALTPTHCTALFSSPWLFLALYYLLAPLDSQPKPL